MVMGEVYIGIVPPTLPTITQVGMVDFQVALLLLVLFMKVLMVMREVGIGLIPATLIPITVMENTVPHIGTLKIIYLGGGGG